MHARDTILHIQHCIIIKNPCKMSASLVKYSHRKGEKSEKKHLICLIMHAIDNICSHVTLSKLHEQLRHDPLHIFRAKVKNFQKTHKSCLLMLTNAS